MSGFRTADCQLGNFKTGQILRQFIQNTSRRGKITHELAGNLSEKFTFFLARMFSPRFGKLKLEYEIISTWPLRLVGHVSYNHMPV